MTRGCGSLSHDSLYHSWPLGTKGIPLSSTIVCPIWQLDRHKLGLSSQGVTFKPRLNLDKTPFLHPETGEVVYDIYDIVGKKFYPFKIDFWEEVKRMGLNRKIPTNAPIHLIDPIYTRHLLCHDLGAIQKRDLKKVIARWQHFQDQGVHHNCDRHGFKHENIQIDHPDKTCFKYWYFEPSVKDCVEHDDAYWRNQMPWGEYHVHPGDERIRYTFGAFMVIPIGRFTGTTPRGDDNLSDRVQKPADILRKKGVPIDVVKLDKGLK